MPDFTLFIEQEKASRINELEIGRYLNFFASSFNDNIDHCKHVLEDYPRWSIISGYYAMHDATKLFIAKSYGLKIERDVHATTIGIMREIMGDREELIQLFETGYQQYIDMVTELENAKRERSKAQYYTGSWFMREEYKRKAKRFLEFTVEPYLDKINVLLGD